MLDQTRAFIEAFASRNGLSERDMLRLELVIEELFTNTVTHGYGNECDQPVEIALSAADGRVSVLYQDAARPYDPLATLATSRDHLAAPVEQRSVGHLGVQLVAGLVDDVRYTRVGDRNELQLSMQVMD